MQEVRGSNPLSSTPNTPVSRKRRPGFCVAGKKTVRMCPAGARSTSRPTESAIGGPTPTGEFERLRMNSMTEIPATELSYLVDAYISIDTATVVAVKPTATNQLAVALDRTILYPTGGGQPHDRGTMDGTEVVDVTKDGTVVWHVLAEGALAPVVGSSVEVLVNWPRRHELMRTHTALHVLCGVVWNRWGVAVTGGNMEPLSARMDFAFDPLPAGFAEEIESLVNAELDANRPIEIGFLPHAAAQADSELIRTKVNMIPTSVTQIRVVNIVGLDRQADGGTHVASTKEVGRLRVDKIESKGKGNKRLRVTILDA